MDKSLCFRYKLTLLSYTRCYKGEKECPFKEENKRLFWEWERWWYEQTALSDDAGCSRISPFLDEYLHVGLSDFERYDNVPITLKAIFFNRFCKRSERIDVDGFKTFYIQYYVAAMEEKVIEKLNEVGLTPDDLTKEELERLKEEVKLEEDGIIIIDGVLSDSKIFYRRLNK